MQFSTKAADPAAVKSSCVVAGVFEGRELTTAAKVIDARGAACPGPLLDAKKAMPGVPVGSVVEIWSSDPVTTRATPASRTAVVQGGVPP